MSLTHAVPEQYQAQLNEKQAALQAQFAEFDMPALEVFDSPSLHYRMRAEFRVWHDQGDLDYIMFKPGSKEHFKIESFPIASRVINAAMPVLIAAIRDNRQLRLRLFQIDFLSALSGELVVSLLYHRKLTDEWKAEAQALKAHMEDAGFNIHIIGRARKMKICLDRDFIMERLTANGRTYTYQQCENSFTQPNGAVAEKMLSWAIDCTQNSAGDLLELYCGNGNFSIALAQNFRQVLATEVAKSSVKSARYNIEANGVNNLRVVRLSAEEVVEAIDEVREFRRLKYANIDLKTYDFKTVFVDPPRAGMDEKSCAMVQRFDRILYISCNPSTLKENLEILTQSHKPTRFALFDQFPYTHHTEAGVLLERRP